MMSGAKSTGKKKGCPLEPSKERVKTSQNGLVVRNTYGGRRKQNNRETRRKLKK